MHFDIRDYAPYPNLAFYLSFLRNKTHHLSPYKMPFLLGPLPQLLPTPSHPLFDNYHLQFFESCHNIRHLARVSSRLIMV